MIGRHSPPRKGAGMRIPKKYEPMIELAEHDEDGW